MIEPNSVICAKFMDTVNDIPRESIDLVFADPPFNVGKEYDERVDDDMTRVEYFEWCAEWICALGTLVAPTGSLYIMNIQRNVWMFQYLLEVRHKWAFQNTIAWQNSSMPVKDKFCINYQPILYYTKSNHYTFNWDAEKHVSKSAMPWGRQNKGISMIDIWTDIPFIAGGCMASGEAILEKGSKKKAHSQQMPLRLAERVIKFSSNEGDIVLDPFAGSGTMAEACKKLKRKYICVEISPKNVDLIKRRLRDAFPYEKSETVPAEDDLFSTIRS